MRIGLTGPIGCGKSTVAGWLARRGAAVIDADQLARGATELGRPALAAVLARFGSSFRRPDGSLDRTALGRLVFADPAALADLEAIVHPAVHGEVVARLSELESTGVPVVAIEAIKLVESGLATLCDEVWLVTCDRAAARARLLGRGTTASDADQRIAAQAGLAESWQAAATRIIDTSGSVTATRALVEAALLDALGSWT